MIVLAWLRKEPKDLKTFVQNRVAKIQELYPNQLWRHVPSDQNPADLVSRGVDPEKLLQQNLWFNGPTFLSGDDYPDRTINCRENLDEYNSELKNCVKGLRSPVIKVSDRGRHVMSSSPSTTKDPSRPVQRCTLNLSKAETSSRWCGVVVRRGCQLRCRPRHLTVVQNYVVRRQKPSCS
ncbi:uncharacterized protein TNCV_2225541 [Trichonephila clavipes]|nr:uncharacterized protein TNCV_2225541 [Trichonephila clavipes]